MDVVFEGGGGGEVDFWTKDKPLSGSKTSNFPGGGPGVAGVPGQGGESTPREPLAEHAGRGERWASLPLLEESAGDWNPPRILDRRETGS